jgi:hypothetical protein
VALNEATQYGVLRLYRFGRSVKQLAASSSPPTMKKGSRELSRQCWQFVRGIRDPRDAIPGIQQDAASDAHGEGIMICRCTQDGCVAP